MKKLPVGTKSFSKIIKDGYIYVDKTKDLYNIIQEPLPYFLSRPRRFGKSLLLNTLKHIFLGHRNLFEGLYIYDQPYDWEPHPVIHIDMSSKFSSTPEALYASLLSELIEYSDSLELCITDTNPVDFFQRLLDKYSKKHGEGRMVVLIDEYDAPILRNIHNSGLAENIRDALKLFYSVLKSKEDLLRFIFITGVTRFTKTSIFSDLNNLVDLTIEPDYANICGFTIEEFDALFQEHMEKSLEPLINNESLPLGSSVADLREKLLVFYDGYSWDGKTKVLNPWSVMNCFRKQKFDNFWFESGTPKFLVDLIKERK
ncbi:MAG: AAA family ATPase, partial [Deltaproteobacteria bacterium]|nr:AAA family ATPase [Deltaproteobacteria bacterium]